MIPKYTKETIDRYVQHKCHPGSFVQSVLENDLVGACSNADDENRYALFEIVEYCWNSIPGVCWGNPEKVDSWLNPEEDKNDISN